KGRSAVSFTISALTSLPPVDAKNSLRRRIRHESVLICDKHFRRHQPIILSGRLLILVVLLLVSSCLAQNTQTGDAGLRTFATLGPGQYDSIDFSNLYIAWKFPVFHK